MSAYAGKLRRDKVRWSLRELRKQHRRQGKQHLCKDQNGRPIFIQCWYWEELRSLYEVAKLQPGTG